MSDPQLIKLLERMIVDTDSQIDRLESGKFRVGEVKSNGELVDRTDEQIAILRGHRKELEIAIQQARRPST
jgi:hypothetical protein